MAKQDPILELSVEKLRLASLDPEIRMQYEAREKALCISIDLQDGMLREGKLEGKLEGKEEVALTMLREGMEISFVIRMTGLLRKL
ncbi:hypothetical protein KHA80_13290 [Anaerobacillus sp. HL2]|nr:hypothetical protein KHA80_13290 [Anaerobacillus sp. HL2]